MHARARRSMSIAMAACVLALASCGASCKSPSEAPGGSLSGQSGAGEPAPGGPPLVVFEPPGKARAAVLVEVVRTRADIERGLMYRRELANNRGMLFLMGRERVQSFWMRNTYIALDMIFIDRDKVVVGVVENATPLTDDSRTVGKPSLYVVEVNAGWTAAHGVGPGTRVSFKNVTE